MSQTTATPKPAEPAASPAPPALSNGDPSDPRFRSCLAFKWLPGNDDQPLHVTPGDAGGATAWGVTIGTCAGWRSMQGIHSTTEADLGRATKAELAELIRSSYWNAVEGDHLPAGVDLLVYDFGYGSGLGTSSRVLQEVLGVTADGRLGPATLAAAEKHDRLSLIRALSAKHEAFYVSLTQDRQFLHGWTNRNNAITALALKT